MVGMFKTSGYRFKVKGRSFKGDMRLKCFTQLNHRNVSHIWNELPKEVVKPGTITTYCMRSILFE